MSLTPEQRAEQSRINGRKSHGPKSSEGKARSRQNAMRHGLRADALPLPGEDPERARERCDAWNDYYQPRSPAAHHLVNECARATLQSDRVAAFQAASLTSQMQNAKEAWLELRRKQVATHVERLRVDPRGALQDLLATAAGCRWLIERWEELEASLQTRGAWRNREAAEACRLLGGIGTREHAWLARLAAVVLDPKRQRNALNRLFTPTCQPASLRDSYTPDKLPSPTKAREWLLGLVAAELETLRAEEGQLIETEEQPALAEVLELAMVPADLNRAAVASPLSIRSTQRLPPVVQDARVDAQNRCRNRPGRLPERTRLGRVAIPIRRRNLKFSNRLRRNVRRVNSSLERAGRRVLRGRRDGRGGSA